MGVGGVGVGNHFFVLKTSKIAMKNQNQNEGTCLSDSFLMLWFQKGFMGTVGFRTFRTFLGGGPGVLNKTLDFGGSKWYLDS